MGSKSGTLLAIRSSQVFAHVLSDYIDGSYGCSRFKQVYPMQMNADRWPGDPAACKLNFGACSGNKMQDLLDNHLLDNSPVDYENFGKSQLVVVTITGNDLDFKA